MIVFDYFCLKKDQFHERVTRKANEEVSYDFYCIYLIWKCQILCWYMYILLSSIIGKASYK